MRFGNVTSGGESSSIQKSIFNIKNILIMSSVVIIGFILSIIIYNYYYVSPQIKSSSSSNNSQENKSAELLFFFANWCPHCKTAKPIWDELKSEYQDKKINGYHIIFTEINCSEETAEVDKMMNLYSVEGYPTIKLLKEGQVIEYDAKPTKVTLTQFLNTVL
jgi:thiol-disulfide isomerase/thioredoxin